MKPVIIDKAKIEQVGRNAAVSSALYELKGELTDMAANVRGDKQIEIYVNLRKPDKIKKGKKNEPATTKETNASKKDADGNNKLSSNPDDKADKGEDSTSGENVKGAGDQEDQPDDKSGKEWKADKGDGGSSDPFSGVKPDKPSEKQ